MNKYILPGLLAGLGALVVSMIFGSVSGKLFPSLAQEYINPNIFRPWSDPLMSLYYLYPFIVGIALAFVWEKTKKLFGGQAAFDRGFYFGLIYWLVAGVSGMLITYSSFQVSLLMVLNWSINGLLEAAVIGVILAKIRP